MEDMVMLPNSLFWKEKKVLLTGHTGFKGGWLALWLHRLGAQVTGFALPPCTQPNLYTLAGISQVTESHFGDVRDPSAVAALVKSTQPEIVLHLAAQPLVRASYRDPIATFSTNVMGTAHVLDALRDQRSVRSVVIITTDKVYRNLEQPYPYREDDALGGCDPYSASKAASELIVSSYRDSYLREQGVAVASARAGNVIGGGDWSEDRLIPDAVRAWEKGEPLLIRRPQAIRPWQHVLEPLAGYLLLAEKMWQTPSLAGAYNFGPCTHEAANVGEVAGLALEAYGKGECLYGQGTEGPHEAGWLALEIAKARHLLGVKPRWDLRESVNRTMRWYAQLASGIKAEALCHHDIDDYERQCGSTPDGAKQ